MAEHIDVYIGWSAVHGRYVVKTDAAGKCYSMHANCILFASSVLRDMHLAVRVAADVCFGPSLCITPTPEKPLS